MSSPRRFPLWSRAAWCVACSLCGCASIDVHEDDRQALFVGARVTKRLEDRSAEFGPHVEAGWTSARGDSGALDFAIDTLALGFGWDAPLGELWGGAVAGLAWQRNDLETAPIDIAADEGLGPYVAIEGGWRANAWFEPYARASLWAAVQELSTTFTLEAGARLYVVEHAAIFAGWRYARFDIDDVDSGLGRTSVELDASGLTLGLVASF